MYRQSLGAEETALLTIGIFIAMLAALLVSAVIFKMACRVSAGRSVTLRFALIVTLVAGLLSSFGGGLVRGAGVMDDALVESGRMMEFEWRKTAELLEWIAFAAFFTLAVYFVALDKVWPECRVRDALKLFVIDTLIRAVPAGAIGLLLALLRS